MVLLMKKLIFFFAVVVAFGMTSCAPDFYCKRCPMEPTIIHEIVIKDSIIIKEVVRDTTIKVYIPPDSMITVVKIVCDSSGLAQLSELIIRKNNMVMRLKVENGVLTQNITQLADSLTFVIQTKDKTIERLQSVNDTLQETKVKKEKYIPRFVQILAVIGGLFLIVLVIFIAYNIGKRCSGGNLFRRISGG